MRKKIHILLLLLFAGVFARGMDNSIANNQLESIIARHIEAYGGEENWARVEALQVTGQYTGFSAVHDFYTLKSATGMFYTEYNLGRHRLKEGFDGDTFWTIDPWQGFDFPRKVNRAEKHVIMQKAELFTPFYRWKERGFEVHLKGEENIDGLDLIVVSLTRPGMTEETWYLDAQTYLAYKSITRWVDFTYPMVAETFYDDYKEVNGLVLPHYLEQTYSTRHTITEIEQVIINPEVDPVVFAMPPCEHMLKIASLAGEWSVEVELMGRTGNWQVIDTVGSVFHLLPNDIMQGDISYEVNFPVITRFVLNFNRRTQQYQMVVYNLFYSTTELFNGTMADDVLTFDDASCIKGPDDSDEPRQASPSTRYILNTSNNDNIILLRQRSSDRGQTWQNVERLTFHKTIH